MQYYGGENTCTNRMRYAQKVRLALALLIVLVARIVEVLWWNLDSGIYRNTNNSRNEINNTNTKVQCTLMMRWQNYALKWSWACPTS